MGSSAKTAARSSAPATYPDTAKDNGTGVLADEQQPPPSVVLETNLSAVEQPQSHQASLNLPSPLASVVRGTTQNTDTAKPLPPPLHSVVNAQPAGWQKQPPPKQQRSKPSKPPPRAKPPRAKPPRVRPPQATPTQAATTSTETSQVTILSGPPRPASTHTATTTTSTTATATTMAGPPRPSAPGGTGPGLRTMMSEIGCVERLSLFWKTRILYLFLGRERRKTFPRCRRLTCCSAMRAWGMWILWIDGGV